jgi:hypothetical protein
MDASGLIVNDECRLFAIAVARKPHTGYPSRVLIERRNGKNITYCSKCLTKLKRDYAVRLPSR